MHKAGNLRFRDGLLENYGDVLTPGALEALTALAPLNEDRRALMRAGHGRCFAVRPAACARGSDAAP